MLAIHRLAASVAAISMLYSTPSHSAESWDFSGQVRAGIEQQSNVNISQIEQASGKADIATLLSAEFNSQWQASEKWTLSGGYSVQDKNYREANDFNTRLHLAHVDAGYQYGNTTYGANYYYALAELDSARFLTLNQASIYAMHTVSASWYLRPALTYTEKTFAEISARNADNSSISADSFWFFNEGQRFVSLGLLYEDENSQDTSFSYQAPGLRLKLSNQFTAWEKSQKIQLGVKVSRRDYRNLDADSAARQDTQSQFEAQWQLNMTPALSLISAIEHGDFSSTLASADYRETRSSVSVQFSF